MRALLIGMVFAVVGHLVARAPRAPRSAPRHWIADRDAHRLLRLDGELGRHSEFELAWPSRVCPVSEGGAWVAAAPGPGRARAGAAPWRMFHLDGEGRVADEIGLPGLLDLAPDPAGGVWALWGNPPRLGRLGAGATPVELPPGALKLALDEEWVLVGFEGGEVLRLDPRGVRAARWIHVPGPVLDLVPASGRGWWILDGLGVLHRRDDELALRWAGRPPLEQPRLARGFAGPQLWIVDRARGAAVRVDAHGRGWRAAELPLAGVECARAQPDGGLLAAGGGAVVRLDARGRLEVGQGGFAFLADL